MSEVTIKMIDKGMGQREITIDLVSDSDMLPHEHEQEHKRVIETLLGQGIIKGSDTVTVTRGGQPTGAVQVPPVQAPPVKQSQAT